MDEALPTSYGWIRRNLFAADLIIVGFWLLLLTLTLLSAPTENTFSLILFLAASIVAYLCLQRCGLAYSRSRQRGQVPRRLLMLVAWVYFVAPFFMVPATFMQLGKVIQDIGTVTPVTVDPDFVPTPGHYDPDHAGENGVKLGPFGAATAQDHQLKRLDQAIFGVYAPEWARQFHSPALSGFMQLGYTFYYIAPMLACVPLLFRRRSGRVGVAPADTRLNDFRTGTAVIAGCILLTYVIYLLVPATGPRFEGGIEAWLPKETGWFGAEAIYRWIDTAELFRWDAFPSGHVAVAFACLFVALRFRPWIGVAMVLPVLFLCCSTVYMGYHYGIDVLAGIACAALAIAVLPRFAAWWEKPNREAVV